MADKITRADRPDRAGMKSMVTFLPPETAKKIKLLAVQMDCTMQDIGEEAWTEWLEKHSSGSLARAKKRA